MKISIVIIHYKAPEMVNYLIQSIEKDEWKGELEFIVVDNSNDLTKDQLPIAKSSIQILKSGYNSGFARGVNLGMRTATGDYIIIINQDAYLHEPNTIKRLIEQAQQLKPKTVLSCRIWGENGEYQQSIWLDNPDIKRVWRFGAIHYKLHPNWKERFEQQTKDIHTKTGFVPRVNGAFFVLRKDEYLKEAYFDEDFFLYGEDVEWALRISKKGWKFYYLSDVSIKHIGSASSSDSSIKLRQIILSDWLAVRKIYGAFYLQRLFWLIRFNLWVDCLLRAWYRTRKGEFPPEYNEEKKQKEENLIYLMKNFKYSLLHEKQFSSPTTFKLNYYAAIQ